MSNDEDFFIDTLSTEPNFTDPSILLDPPILPMFSTINPRTIMGDEWWKHKRREVIAANNDCCYACGVHATEAKYKQWIEVHERFEYNYKRRRVTIKGYVGLCHSCHNFIHRGRMSIMVKRGAMSDEKASAITLHGYRLLAENRLLGKQIYHPSEVIRNQHKWKKWRMIFQGKKIKPRFLTAAEADLFFENEANKDD